MEGYSALFARARLHFYIHQYLLRQNFANRYQHYWPTVNSYIMANVCSSATLSVCQLYDPYPRNYIGKLMGNMMQLGEQKPAGNR